MSKMALQNIENIDNPFTKLKFRKKFRHLLLRFIVLYLLISFLLEILLASASLKFNQQNLVVIQFVLLCLWSLRDFQRLRVKLKYVVGDLLKNQR